MARAAAYLRAVADNVAVILFAAMFGSFMLQIVSRYVLQDPYGWTIEASQIAWLWIVFWGSGLLLRNADHVRFDVLYGWVRQRTRRVFALVSAACIVAAYAVSLPATIDYVTFMRIERSGTLGIRLDYIFSVYLVFAIAVIARYALHGARTARGADPDAEPGREAAAGPGA